MNDNFPHFSTNSKPHTNSKGLIFEGSSAYTNNPHLPLKSRNDGGHNGLKNLIELTKKLNTTAFNTFQDTKSLLNRDYNNSTFYNNNM